MTFIQKLTFKNIKKHNLHETILLAVHLLVQLVGLEGVSGWNCDKYWAEEKGLCVCVCVCVCVYVYRVWREEAMKSSKTQSVPGNEIPEHLDDGE